MEPSRITRPRENNRMPDEPACFECDTATSTEWREHAFTYGVGASAVELSVTLPVRICDTCGLEFLDDEAETLQHEAICAHLDVLTPKEIRGIREMHCMSRAEFSRVTGLGEATLNRWENAILIQNKANDRVTCELTEARTPGFPKAFSVAAFADRVLPYYQDLRRASPGTSGLRDSKGRLVAISAEECTLRHFIRSRGE